MAKRIGHTTGNRESGYITAFWLRQSILEEERLRQALTRDEELRRTHPNVWPSMEAARRAENNKTAAANQRLRALGFEPVPLRPSLAQRRQKLHRLQQRNAVEIAAFTSKSGKSGPQAHGTGSARRRSRSVDDER